MTPNDTVTALTPDPAEAAKNAAYAFVLALANPQLTDAQAAFEGFRAVFAAPWTPSEAAGAYQTAWTRLNKLVR